VAVALLLVSAAWLMEHAGMSLAMGAFLAGVLLADSPFRHQVVADIQPFRGILLGLFFMTVACPSSVRPCSTTVDAARARAPSWPSRPWRPSS
jgi:Kef-type K+ transport system membrane component KefB